MPEHIMQHVHDCACERQNPRFVVGTMPEGEGHGSEEGDQRIGPKRGKPVRGVADLRSKCMRVLGASGTDAQRCQETRPSGRPSADARRASFNGSVPPASSSASSVVARPDVTARSSSEYPNAARMAVTGLVPADSAVVMVSMCSSMSKPLFMKVRCAAKFMEQNATEMGNGTGNFKNTAEDSSAG